MEEKQKQQVQEASNDVVICGGGLAGLCLALQLHQKRKDIKITILEKEYGPLPDSIVKVGESTIETGAYYYAHVLGLESYLNEAHIRKLGLRYFFPADSFVKRPEFGVARHLPVITYQLDRGLLENHLREMLISAGVRFIEGATVGEIALAEGDEAHQVHYKLNGVKETLSCRWVVDAMSRRRYLQRKLKLNREVDTCHSSAWFRLSGQLNADTFVNKEEEAWHQRISMSRWNSTCQLMGQGYWVWIIPLSPGNTSVGIVTDERYHPFSEYDTYEKARAWLLRNEPEVASRLDQHELLDFKKLKGYTYTSTQVFSAQRWICAGEAGVFADPYYSVGSNMIAFSNGFATEIIDREMDGRLDIDYVNHANRLFLTLNDALTHTIQDSYCFFHCSRVMGFKTIWDYYIGWSTTDPQFYHDVYLDPEKSAALSNLISRVIVAQERIKQLFRDWAERLPEPTKPAFGFIDYIQDLPTLTNLFVTNLPPKNLKFGQVLKNARDAVFKIEEFAQLIFFTAVADLMPERLAQFPQRWVEVSAISLNPDSWEADGLFQPKSQPRDLTYIYEEMGRLMDLNHEAPALVNS